MYGAEIVYNVCDLLLLIIVFVCMRVFVCVILGLRLFPSSCDSLFPITPIAEVHPLCEWQGIGIIDSTRGPSHVLFPDR
jgi:hypothetical protein